MSATRRRSPRDLPRRTRRVGAPFDARLEVRLYQAELDKLHAEAKARGMSIADLVRFQLGDLIAIPPPPDPRDVPRLDLRQVIEDAGLMRYAMAALKIRTGHVQVDGKTWYAKWIPANRLAGLRVDGEPLPEANEVDT